MIDFERVETLIKEEALPEAFSLLVENPVAALDEADFERLERCLSALPEKTLSQSPQGCFLCVCADLRLGRTHSARQWYNQLTVLRDQQKEGTRAWSELVRYICLAGIMLPQTDNAQILLLLSILHNETISQRLPPISLSVTERRPSVLRGGKDFSEWGKNYRAVANIVGSLQDSVLPEGGAGAIPAAVAELLYEHGNLNAASIEVAGALSSPSTETAFAGYAQLARIARLDGASSCRPDDVLQKLGGLLEERGASHLLPNYRALCARFDIHYGRLESVKAWLEESQVDGLKDCRPSNLYELMTQSKALMALGRCREAVTLLESLLLILKSDIRPLDTIECLVDSAIACALLESENLALDKMEEALLTAVPYRYVRVIADGGRVAFQLVNQLVKSSRRVRGLPANYLKKVLDAAKIYSMLFPRLYSQDSPLEPIGECQVTLTPTELQILQILSQGDSNREICERLHIKLPTVKSHISSIFEKLKAKNRMEAVTEAKKLQII